TYAYRSTSTGFNDQDWSYSTDGVNFTQITSVPLTTDGNFQGPATVDLSAVAALNNQSNVYLKATFMGASASGGNTRIDNVQFNATPAAGGLPNAIIGSDITSGLTTYSGEITLNGPAALTSASGGTVVFSGNISGSDPAAVVKVGAGKVVLSHQNAY